MSISTCLRRTCAKIAVVSLMGLPFAQFAHGQLSTAANQLGKQVLTGPNPAEDPNFQEASSKVTIPSLGGDVSWIRYGRPVLDWHEAGDPNLSSNIPGVMVPRLPNGRPPGTADYMGFVDGVGSLLEAAPKGGIYIFNASAQTLTRKYDTIDQVPLDVLAALKNRKYIYESSREPLHVLADVVAAANKAAAPAPAKPYELDANLAGAPADNSPLTWDETRTSFTVRLPQLPPVAAMYLGFNERGSWIASALGKLFLWNRASKTLEPVSDDWWDAPLDLHNPSVITQAMIFYRQHAYRSVATRGDALDPNLSPDMVDFSRSVLAASWQFEGNDPTRPLVFTGASELGVYMGFDERGSWIQSAHGGIYVWSFRTWKLERIARDANHVPKEALARLHHPGTAAVPVPARP